MFLFQSFIYTYLWNIFVRIGVKEKIRVHPRPSAIFSHGITWNDMDAGRWGWEAIIGAVVSIRPLLTISFLRLVITRRSD